MRYANVCYSWLPKVQRNLRLSRPVVLAAVVQLPLEVRPLLVVLLQLRRRKKRRKKRKRKSQTRIWVSVCSTRELRSSLFECHQMEEPHALSDKKHGCRDNADKCIYVAPSATPHNCLCPGALQGMPLRPILAKHARQSKDPTTPPENNARVPHLGFCSCNDFGVPKSSIDLVTIVEKWQSASFVVVLGEHVVEER
jgi:hypothetical protein